MEHQPPMPIEWSDIDPHQWCLEALPDVDLVRPPACPICLTAAKIGGRVILQGHGKRQREVVVPAVVDEEDDVELLDCWVRRYRCVLCGAVITVLPKGVLPRYLYSAAAMVMALLLVANKPVGEGKSDAAAYDRQGMNPRRRWTKSWPYRWRSLDRWFAMAGTWWPGRAVGNLEALLTGFVVDAQSDARREVLAAAVGTHVRWGCAM
jgi:hypothetical protein